MRLARDICLLLCVIAGSCGAAAAQPGATPGHPPMQPDSGPKVDSEHVVAELAKQSGYKIETWGDANPQPYVRNHIVAALGAIKDEPAIVAKLVDISRDDTSYRSRANALQSLGKLKAATAYPGDGKELRWPGSVG